MQAERRLFDPKRHQQSDCCVDRERDRSGQRNRAVLRPPHSLDAWQAYHRGLWHMYRFTQPENEAARRFFEMAVRLDPTFARAHAGLSFTHWQSAFQHWGDRKRHMNYAMEAAGRGLIVDEHDPAAHWAMGRALWLRAATTKRSVNCSRP